MRLGLLSATWRRPQLTEAVLGYYSQLEIPGIDFVRVAAVSPEDPEPAVIPPGWIPAIAPNEPLGRKWNIGMRTLRSYNPDAVVIVGSDDLLNATYFERIRKAVSEGAEFVELSGLYFYDVETGKAIFARSKRIGPGRCVSKALLNRVNWACWEMDQKSPLGGSLYRVFGLPGVAVRKISMAPPNPLCEVTLLDTKEHGIICVDIKSRNEDGTTANVWDYEAMADRLKCEEVDGTALLKSEFSAVAESLGI